MRLGLLLVLLSLPLIELALLIKVGQWIGFWPTMLILVGTAIGGGLVLHQQGFAALNRLLAEMREGRPPIEAAVDGAFILFAGMLLITPGLITDTCGLLLLVPPLRRAFARWLLGRIDTYVEVRTGRSDPQRESRGPERYDPHGGGVVIEGEYKRIDEPPSPPPPRSDADPHRRPPGRS